MLRGNEIAEHGKGSGAVLLVYNTSTCREGLIVRAVYAAIRIHSLVYMPEKKVFDDINSR
jgi:hypothetical protein